MDDIDAILSKHSGPDDVDAILAKHASPSLGGQALDTLKDAAGRGIQGAVSSLPGASSFQAFRIPGASGYDKAGAVAGDIGGGILAGATGGLSIPAGMLMNAGLEASGINPLARKAEAAIEGTTAKGGLYPDAQTQSVAKNMLFNLPKNLLGTAVGIAPSVVASMGMAKAMPQASALFKTPEAPIDSATLASAAEAEKRGIPITQSALKPNDIQERGYTDNPLTQGIADQFKKKQDAALVSDFDKSVGSQFSPDTMSQSAGRLGEQLGQGVQDFKKGMSQKYDDLEKRVAEAPLPDGKPAGVLASNKIIDYLAENGMTSDEKGFNPSLLTGNEKIDPVTGKTLIDIERKVRNAQTIGDLIQQRKNFDKEAPNLFKGDPSTQKMQQKVVRNLINESISDALAQTDEKSSQQMRTPLKDEYDSTNKEYSQTIGPVNKAVKTMETVSPEDRFKNMVLNKGAQGAKQLQGIVGKQTVQDMAIKHLKDASMTGDSLSLDKLKTQWNKTFDPDLKKAIFDPGQIKQVDDFIKNMEFSQAPQTVMKVPRNGGSPTQPKTAIQKATDFATGDAGAMAVGGGLGYLLGHSPMAGMLGASLGQGIKSAGTKIMQNRTIGQAQKFFNPEKGFYQPPPPKPTAPQPSPNLLAALMAARARQENQVSRAAGQ